MLHAGSRLWRLLPRYIGEFTALDQGI